MRLYSVLMLLFSTRPRLIQAHNTIIGKRVIWPLGRGSKHADLIPHASIITCSPAYNCCSDQCIHKVFSPIFKSRLILGYHWFHQRQSGWVLTTQMGMQSVRFFCTIWKNEIRQLFVEIFEKIHWDPDHTTVSRKRFLFANLRFSCWRFWWAKHSFIVIAIVLWGA